MHTETKRVQIGTMATDENGQLKQRAIKLEPKLKLSPFTWQDYGRDHCKAVLFDRETMQAIATDGRRMVFIPFSWTDEEFDVEMDSKDCDLRIPASHIDEALDAAKRVKESEIAFLPPAVGRPQSKATVTGKDKATKETVKRDVLFPKVESSGFAWKQVIPRDEIQWQSTFNPAYLVEFLAYATRVFGKDCSVRLIGRDPMGPLELAVYPNQKGEQFKAEPLARCFVMPMRAS